MTKTSDCTFLSFRYLFNAECEGFRWCKSRVLVLAECYKHVLNKTRAFKAKTPNM